jgi:thiol peroxidase
VENTITLEKEPLTLVGRSLEIGTPAPPFTAVSTHMEEVGLATYGEKIKLTIFFPSIDHPVCDLQVREMNRRAKDLPESVAVIGISRDTPFALKRFRETFGIRNLELISDQRYGSFGISYGVLIRELNLLCRGAVILDWNDLLRYRQIVHELSHQPDFDDIMKHLWEIVRGSAEGGGTPLHSRRESGEGEASSLSPEAVSRLMSGLSGWELVEGKRISKRYTFKSFIDAKLFLDLICTIAVERDHHPSLTLNYNTLHVSLTTHAAGGPTGRDFTMARLIDSLT